MDVPSLHCVFPGFSLGFPGGAMVASHLASAAWRPVASHRVPSEASAAWALVCAVVSVEEVSEIEKL